MTVASPHSPVFGEAIRPFLELAYRVAEHLTDSPQIAEACVAEAAMLGRQVRPRIEPGLDPGPWFLGLVVRCCGGRHRRRDVPIHETGGSEPLQLYEATRAAGWHEGEGDPVGRFFARVDSATLAAALRSLPWEHRVAATAYYVTGWSYADLALLLGITRAELRPRLHRARAAMQGALYARAKAAGIIPAA